VPDRDIITSANASPFGWHLITAMASPYDPLGCSSAVEMARKFAGAYVGPIAVDDFMERFLPEPPANKPCPAATFTPVLDQFPQEKDEDEDEYQNCNPDYVSDEDLRKPQNFTAFVSSLSLSPTVPLTA